MHITSVSSNCVSPSYSQTTDDPALILLTIPEELREKAKELAAGLDLPPQAEAAVLRIFSDLSSLQMEWVAEELREFDVLDEEKPEAVALLKQVPSQEVAPLLHYANSLKMSFRHKLKALHFLMQIGDLSQVATTVYEVNALRIPNEHRLQALALFYQRSFDEIDTLQELVNGLDLPNEERLEALHLLIRLASQEDPQFFCSYLKILFKRIDNKEKLPVMQRHLFTPQERLSEIFQGIDRLRDHFQIESSDDLPFLQMMEHIEKGGLSRFIRATGPFISELFMDESERIAILLALSKIPRRYWKRVDALLKFWMGTHSKTAVLEAFTKIPKDSFGYVIEQASRLLTFTAIFSIADQAVHFPKIARIPKQFREQFNAMSKEDRLSILQNLPHASEDVCSYWWLSSSRDRAELTRLQNENSQRAFMALNPEEQESYFTVPLNEREGFLQLGRKERKQALQQIRERKEECKRRIDEAKLEIQEEEEFLQKRRRTQRTLHWFHNTKLLVNWEELSEHPHRALLDFLHKTDAVEKFPLVGYIRSDGHELVVSDAGGPTRQFATRLFEALFQEEKSKLPMIRTKDGEAWIPQIASLQQLSLEEQEALSPSQLLIFSEETQKQCYRAIGALFARALLGGSKGNPATTGIYFHQCVFEMLYSLRLSDPVVMEGRCLRAFLKSYYAELFDVWNVDEEVFIEEMDDLILREKISQRLRECGLNEVLWADLQTRSQGVVRAMMEIGKAMHDYYPEWRSVRGSSADTLRTRIAGIAGKGRVLWALNLQEESEDEHKNYVRRWVLESSSEQVEQLVSAICGSKTLTEKQKLKVIVSDDINVGNWPEFYTCPQQMTMPRYPDYETFKSKLEAALARIAEDSKKGVLFQGLQ